MTNLDNTCSHNLDMAELDYNPSKRDLTDARIHHLLAEELKPYRRVCIVLRASTSKLFLHNNHFDLDFYTIAVPVITTTTTILKHIHTHSPSYRVPLFDICMSLVLDLTEANLCLVVVIVLYAFTLVSWAFRSETRSLLAISFLYPYSSTLSISLSLSRSVFSRSIYIHSYLLCILFYICRPYIYIDIFVINCLFDFFPSNRTQLNLNFSTTTRIENI